MSLCSCCRTVFLLVMFALPFAGMGAVPVYNVKDFGASGTRAQDATAYIQRAIDSASANGGGIVWVPGGEYSSMPIVLRSNIIFHLEAGAVIYADLANPAWKGQALIYAENARHITLRGKGRIDGQAEYVYENVRGAEPEIKEEMEIAHAAGIEMKRYYRAPGRAAAFNLLLKACEDVIVEDITLTNSSLWCMRIWGCDRVNIRGINVFSSLEKGVNSDGIDIDGSRNVHVSGSNISVGDDAICIKSGTWRWDGKNKINTAENIVVDNCILSSSSAAMKLGTESYGDMRHIVFSNCVIRNSNKGVEITVKDGANVSDVIFSNLTMDLRRRHWNWWGDGQVFFFELTKRRDSSKGGTIRNVQVSNVIAHAQGTSRIVSHLDTPIENFTISNMKIFMEPESTPDKRTSNAMQFTNVAGLKLKDVEIYWAENNAEPKWKSSVVLENVKGFELRGIDTRQAHINARDPAILVKSSIDGLIFNCVAQKHTGTFIRIEGKESDNIVLGNNFTHQAAIPVSTGPGVKKQAVVK